jgi:hypothetical protein
MEMPDCRGHGSHGVVSVSTYVIARSFSLTLIINDMKRFYKKLFKSKRPSLGSIHGPEPATLTSTLITNTAALIPMVPVSDATASAQVTDGASVSYQLRRCFAHHILKYGLLCYRILSNRPLIIMETLPRFPLRRSVIFLL